MGKKKARQTNGRFSHSDITGLANRLYDLHTNVLEDGTDNKPYVEFMEGLSGLTHDARETPDFYFLRSVATYWKHRAGLEDPGTLDETLKKIRFAVYDMDKAYKMSQTTRLQESRFFDPPEMSDIVMLRWIAHLSYLLVVSSDSTQSDQSKLIAAMEGLSSFGEKSVMTAIQASSYATRERPDDSIDLLLARKEELRMFDFLDPVVAHAYIGSLIILKAGTEPLKLVDCLDRLLAGIAGPVSNDEPASNGFIESVFRMQADAYYKECLYFEGAYTNAIAADLALSPVKRRESFANAFVSVVELVNEMYNYGRLSVHEAGFDVYDTTLAALKWADNVIKLTLSQKHRKAFHEAKGELCMTVMDTEGLEPSKMRRLYSMAQLEKSLASDDYELDALRDESKRITIARNGVIFYRGRRLS